MNLPASPRAACILAVDDAPAALYATSRILRSAGYEVLEATTGSAALELASRSELVVLDVNLPDIDGFEVCRRLRSGASTATLPVLHLSATFTQNSDFTLGLEAGADGYLTRPVEPTVLLATVRTLLFARQSEQVRRTLDSRLRTVFELAPVAIATLDAANHYRSLNPAFCALLQSGPAELLGSSALPFFGVVDAESAAARSAPPALAFELREHGRTTLCRRDRSTVTVEWKLAQADAAGVRVLVAEDITGRLHAESERAALLDSERAARAEAERSNRLKDEFLATLSHELRTPLNAILGWATVIGRTPELPPTVNQGVRAIERNSRLQAQMIGDLLDYAGVSFGKLRIIPVRLDPFAVVRAALDVVQSEAQAGAVLLAPHFDDGTCMVEADPARLQQITLNLLTNAIKFSPRGATVEVIAKACDGAFRLEVRDHGKGIAAAFLPRIFERFTQQDGSRSRSHGGLGIGLAIARELVDLHGGVIEARSAGDGQGASFVVRLPLVSAAAQALQEPREPSRFQELEAIDVLVVDDDPDALQFTSRILSDAGTRVVTAASAVAATAAVRERRFDVLVSDIGMAGEDGYELMRRIRRQGLDAAALPAVALTAYSRMQDRADALAAGFQEHLVKPVDPQALLRAVSAVLAARTPRSDPGEPQAG